MTKRSFDLAGWWLFTASAICFTIASWGSWVAFAGGLLFLIACIVFMVPFYVKMDDE